MMLWWLPILAAMLASVWVADGAEPPLRWVRDMGGVDGVATLSYSEGVLYAHVSSYLMKESTVYALSTQNGSILWNIGTGIEGVVQPTIAGSILYCVSGTLSGQSHVFALNASLDAAAPDRTIWDYLEIYVSPVSPVAAADGCPLVFLSAGDFLVALDAHIIGSGNMTWKFTPPSPVTRMGTPTLVPHQKAVIVISSVGMYSLEAYNALSAVVKWHIPDVTPIPNVQPEYIDPPPFVDTDTNMMYLASGDAPGGTEGCSIQAYYMMPNGQEVHRNWSVNLWKEFKLHVIPTMPVYAYDLVFFSSRGHSNTDGHIYALHAANGTKAWISHKVNTDFSRVSVGNRLVYTISGSQDIGRVFAFEVETGNMLWQRELTGKKKSPINESFTIWPLAVESDVYIGSSYMIDSESSIYDFGPASQTVTVTEYTTITPSITATFTEEIPDSPPGVDWKSIDLLLIFSAGSLVIILLISCMIHRFIRSRADSSTGVGSKYNILKKLGSGAYGVVYLVRRKCDSQLFAMKYSHCSDDQQQEEALNEFKLIRAFQGHPNMIQVVETFMSWNNSVTPLNGKKAQEERKDDEAAHLLLEETARYVCLVMPYYKNGDLKRYVTEYPSETIPESVLLSMVEQICSLLHHLHFRQPPLIHRDLKPENILIDDDQRPIVTDFGLARNLEDMYCSTRAGTAAFLAPECWSKHYGIEVDIWAVGCIMYAAATKRVLSSNLRIMFCDALKPGFTKEITDELESRGYSSFYGELVVSMLQADYHKRPRACDVLSCLRKRRVEFDCPGNLTSQSEQAEREGINVAVPTTISPIEEEKLHEPSSSTQYGTTNEDSQATILIGSSCGYEFLNGNNSQHDCSVFADPNSENT